MFALLSDMHVFFTLSCFMESTSAWSTCCEMSQVNAVTVDLRALAGRWVGRCDDADENDLLSRTIGQSVAVQEDQVHALSSTSKRFWIRVTSEMFPSLHPNAGVSCTFLKHQR